VTAYLPYSQLPSIAGGRLLRPQPEDVPGRSIKGHSKQNYDRNTLHISASSWCKELSFCADISNKVHGARFYVLTAVLMNNISLLGCDTVLPGK